MRKVISATIGCVLLAATPVFAALPSVDVPLECSVVDTDGTPHSFAGQYLGVCALEAARTQSIISAYELKNFSFGLFLQSLNGIAPGGTEYWALYHNGIPASVGLADLVVAQGDILKFQLTDWSTNTDIGSPIEFSIGSLIASQSSPVISGSSGSGEFLEARHFNVESAFDFLVSKQASDGSFGSPMLTDWAAIAFGVATDEVCNDACPLAREKLRFHLLSAKPELSSVTDFERHAMALEAFGINPYSEAPVDYIESITSAFDGTQMGDPTLVNDDIFALFPLMHAGYATTDEMIQEVRTFILSKQKINGSWEESVDLTAAAIQALAPFNDDRSMHAIKKAEEFLRRNQNESGIFSSNSFSLSWALQAIASLGQTPDDWKKSGLTPLEHLGVFQQNDGGVEPTTMSADTRVWATAYAIPAAFGKSWNYILQDFTRPAPIEPLPLVAPTSSPPESALLPKQPVTVARASVAAPELALVATNEIVQSATTEATTSDSNIQTAAATEAASDNVSWVWIAGLILIFGAVFYFLRRA